MGPWGHRASRPVALFLLPATALLAGCTPDRTQVLLVEYFTADFPMPEDRDAEGGRSIDLNVVVLPARRYE